MSDYPMSVSSGRPHQWRVTSGNAAGPPLPMMAIIFAALFLASVVGVGAAAGGAHLPSPYDPVSKLSAYLALHHEALQISSLLQFASAVPLAIFAAAVAARLHHLGIRAPGATIALAGGISAAGMLIVSASSQWVLAQSGMAQNLGVARGFQDLAFITGGPAHVVTFGLLLAGIAVVAAFTGILRRPLALAGIVLAAAAEISALTFAVHGIAILLPIARFAGYAWIVAAAFMLPRPSGATTAR